MPSIAGACFGSGRHHPGSLTRWASLTVRAPPPPPTAPSPSSPRSTSALDYFADRTGRPRGVAKMPGSGPPWVTAYVTLPDKNGQPHLVASFFKSPRIPRSLPVGLCVWMTRPPPSIMLASSGRNPKPRPSRPHSPRATSFLERRAWQRMGAVRPNPFPRLRCRPPSRMAGRSELGKPSPKPRWRPRRWKSPSHRTPARSLGIPGANAVTIFHAGSWQTLRWAKLWYDPKGRRADRGPWGPAVKVLSHDKHTFYNRRLHPEFTRQLCCPALRRHLHRRIRHHPVPTAPLQLHPDALPPGPG